MSNIDEKLASIPTSPLLAERMTKEQPSRESDTEITRCSNDTISRQAAIDALHMNLMYRMGTDSNKKRLDEWINNLPSAQQERPKGHWVEIGDEPFDEWECDMCGFVIDGSDYIDPGEYRDVYKFCPNCGADMRKREGDNV
jgi:hypothetical protein